MKQDQVIVIFQNQRFRNAWFWNRQVCLSIAIYILISSILVFMRCLCLFSNPQLTQIHPWSKEPVYRNSIFFHINPADFGSRLVQAGARTYNIISILRDVIGLRPGDLFSVWIILGVRTCHNYSFVRSESLSKKSRRSPSSSTITLLGTRDLILLHGLYGATMHEGQLLLYPARRIIILYYFRI